MLYFWEQTNSPSLELWGGRSPDIMWRDSLGLMSFLSNDLRRALKFLTSSSWILLFSHKVVFDSLCNGVTTWTAAHQDVSLVRTGPSPVCVGKSLLQGCVSQIPTHQNILSHSHLRVKCCGGLGGFSCYSPPPRSR